MLTKEKSANAFGYSLTSLLGPTEAFGTLKYVVDVFQMAAGRHLHISELRHLQKRIPVNKDVWG